MDIATAATIPAAGKIKRNFNMMELHE